MTTPLVIIILFLNALVWYFYRCASDEYESENADALDDTSRLLSEDPIKGRSCAKYETDDRVTYFDVKRYNKGYRRMLVFDRNGRFLGAKPSLARYLAVANLLSLAAILIVRHNA